MTAPVKKRIAGDVASFDGDWRHTFATASEWAKLKGPGLVEALAENWSKISRPADKKQILKALFFSRHPRTLDILDLGMKDRDPAIQLWAAEYLGALSFRTLSPGSRQYVEWRERFKGKSLDQVLHDNAAEFVEGLRRVPADHLPSVSFKLYEHVKSANIPFLTEAGLVDLLEHWISTGPEEVIRNAFRALRGCQVDQKRLQKKLADWLAKGSDEIVRNVLVHIPQLELDAPFLKKSVVPLLKSRPAHRAAAVRALGRKGNAWAVDLLLPFLNDPREDTVLAAAESLAEIGDKRAIPAMIEAVKRDNTTKTIYGVGCFGLAPLTGVTYDPTQDGAWWEGWWKKSGTRLR